VVDAFGGPACRVSFSYSDPHKAQAVVKRLVASFAGQAPSAEDTAKLEVVRLPDLPTRPIEPDRMAFGARGLGLGLAAGWVASAFWRRPKRSLRLIAWGLTGCVAAGGLSMLIPDRYESTALLRFIPGEGDPNNATRMTELASEVLSRSSLLALIGGPSLDPYRFERPGMSGEQMADRARARDFRAEPVDSPLSNSMPELRIAFRYRDRFKAQQVVREMVGKFVDLNFQRYDGQSGRPGIEVLEAANAPETPVSPNRLVISLAGMAAGLGMGAWFLRGADGGKRPKVPSLADR